MAKTIQEALEHSTYLVQDYKNQKDLMDEMDKMYFMEWEDKPQGKEFKFTTSPSARNALLGAIRLMTSTEPNFFVPYDKNLKDAKAISERIEKLCKSIWYQSGRFKGVPLEQPAIEALLRYGMMVLAIYDTEDLKQVWDKQGASKAQKRQVQRLVDSTPYLIEAYDPKTVYPEWGRFGLNSVYREVEMTVAEVIDQFGEKVVFDIIGEDQGGLNERVRYADYWDLEKHMAWIACEIGGRASIAGEPIIDTEHDLPCIPIIIQTSEGSYMDVEREYQALPFLYGVSKSGLWERQNLEMTYMYTNLFHISANPTFIHETVGDGELITDYETPGGRIVLRNGENFRQMDKDIFNDDLMKGLQIADELVEKSTIHSQALGGVGHLGANAAFSTVSLLHQAGRLPLVSPQKRGGWGMGAAMELIFEMMKDKGEKRKAKTKEGYFTFDPKEIPDDLIIEARLEVDLPQDQLSQANVAQLITQSGLASRRWAQENILNIGQSEEMQKEIYDELAEKQEFQRTLEQFEIMRQQGMQQQMMAQQGMAQGQPPMPQGPQMPPMPQPPQARKPRGPMPQVMAQEGLIPAQRPGAQPVPPNPEGMPLQEGEM